MHYYVGVNTTKYNLLLAEAMDEYLRGQTISWGGKGQIQGQTKA